MASGIRNPNATYTYVGENWDTEYPNSGWTFKMEQTGDDRDIVANMTTKRTLGKIDRKKVRELLKTGGDVDAYVSEATNVEALMSAEKAMLGRMGVKVEGPFFTVPENYTDEDGFGHPMAGKLIPQPPPRSLERTNKKQYQADLDEHLHWLGLLDPDERSAALEFMTAVWAGRDPEDLKAFQGDSGSVDKPAGRKRDKAA